VGHREIPRVPGIVASVMGSLKVFDEAFVGWRGLYGLPK